MNLRFKKFYLFIFSTFLVAGICSKSYARYQTPEVTVDNPKWGIWQDRDEPVIEFETVQTFGAENQSLDEIIPSNPRRVVDIFADEDENIYLLNYETSRLLSFDREGNIRWAVGQKGQGPGDFAGPNSMTWDGEEYIYIFNRGSMRIDRYNLKGDYLRSFFIPKEVQLIPDRLEYLEPDGIVGIAATGREYGARVGMFSIEGDELNYESDFVINTEPILEVPVGYYYFPPNREVDNQIFVGHKRQYAFDIYNTNGQLKKRVSRNYDVIVKPGIVLEKNLGPAGYSGIFVDAFGGVFPPVKLTNQYYLQAANWAISVEDPDAFAQDVMNGNPAPILYKNSIDLLDADFNLLFSTETLGKFNPDIGKLISTDQNGHIYTHSTDPYPHIKKVKVIIHD